MPAGFPAFNADILVGANTGCGQDFGRTTIPHFSPQFGSDDVAHALVRLEFLHFGTDFLTVPPRIDQAEAHALYQGMASAVPLEAVNSGL